MENWKYDCSEVLIMTHLVFCKKFFFYYLEISSKESVRWHELTILDDDLVNLFQKSRKNVFLKIFESFSRLQNIFFVKNCAARLVCPKVKM